VEPELATANRPAASDTGSGIVKFVQAGMIGIVAWIDDAIVFSLAAGYLYLFNFRDGVFIWTLSQQEGGITIDEAFRVLHGDVIYRDFFEFLTPGIVYINAFFLWLLGPTTTSVGLIVIIIGALGTVATYAISASVLARPWCFAPPAIFVGLTYPSYSQANHKWPAIIFCLVAILAVVRTQTRLRCAFSGFALGCAMLSTQDYGVGATFGMVLALWLLRERSASSGALICMITSALTVASAMTALAIVAGFGNVWHDVVGFPLERYGLSQAFAFAFLGEQYFPLWLTAYGLGGLALLYTAIGIVRRFWREDPPSLVIIALTGAGLLVIGNTPHQIEPTLFATGSVPLSIVGVYLLQRATQLRYAQPWLPIALLGLGIIIAIHAISDPMPRGYGQPSLDRFTQSVHRAGKIWAASSQDDLTWVEANASEGELVFLFPDKGGLYFLSRTRNATSYAMMFDMGLYSDRQIADAIRQLTWKCPSVGIWDQGRLASFVEKRPEWFTLKPLWLALSRDYDIAQNLPNHAYALRRKAIGCGLD